MSVGVEDDRYRWFREIIHKLRCERVDGKNPNEEVSMKNNLKSQFLLNPDILYFNHGSFGACPRPVFESYQRWQREMEREPVQFLARRAPDLMADARAALAEFLGCHADEVVYFTNPTTALNMVARSLDLQPGDEILTTDHEYGALDRTWRFICNQRGAHYIRQPIPLPLTTPEAFVDRLWEGITERTRILFLSHITSPTALRFPVAAVCRRAHEHGLLCIVDGAHAPGQIPLDLTALGADIYAGACHKWLGAPKGSAFLYARQEVQELLQPLVVSWGWEAEKPGPSRFIDHHEWQGTRDLAAFLATPAAIRFQREHNWDTVREHCHQLASEVRQRLLDVTNLPPICPDSQEWYVQMFAAQLPELDVEKLQRRLFEEHRIEVAVKRWNDRPLIRISIQAYNSQRECERMIETLEDILPATLRSLI
jgi:isopenicillin-N epimerase